VAVREFRDTREREWRVWDVRPEEMHPVTRAEAFTTGYRDGWLAFESKDGEVRKRLVLYPMDWQTLPPEGLERLLQEAEVVRARARRTGASSADVTGVGGAGESESHRRDDLRVQVPWIEEAAPSAPTAASAASDVAAPPASRTPAAAGGGGGRGGEGGEGGQRVTESPSRVVRSFFVPRGRLWTVYEQRIAVADAGGGASRPRIVLRFRSGSRTLDVDAWPADWATLSDQKLVELLWHSNPRDPTAANPTPHRRRRGDARA
jgi:hypothetical protein